MIATRRRTLVLAGLGSVGLGLAACAGNGGGGTAAPELAAGNPAAGSAANDAAAAIPARAQTAATAAATPMPAASPMDTAPTDDRRVLLLVRDLGPHQAYRLLDDDDVTPTDRWVLYAPPDQDEQQQVALADCLGWWPLPMTG